MRTLAEIADLLAQLDRQPAGELEDQDLSRPRTSSLGGGDYCDTIECH
jgi:hypothetical protein